MLFRSGQIAKRLPPFLAVLTLIPIVVLAIDNRVEQMPIYFTVFGICILQMILFKFTSLKEHPLIILYSCGTAFLVMEIYLSVVGSPDHRASILLGTFAIFPLFIIDKRRKIVVFCSFFYIVHTILAFKLKGPGFGFDDLINCLCMMMLGLFVGNIFQTSRLALNLSA